LGSAAFIALQLKHGNVVKEFQRFSIQAPKRAEAG